MTENDHRSPESRGFGGGYSIVSAGFQLAVSILLFLWLGSLADRWLGTRPLFLLLGIAVGLGAGFYAFMRRVLAVSKGPGKKQ